MKFKIEKGIPLPPLRNQQLYPKGKNPMPLDKLDVGDSFQIPVQMVNQARVFAASRSRATGKRFSVRVPENQEARVWRVK